MKSVSNEVTFFEDLGDRQLLLRTIRGISEKVGRRLRHKALSGKTVRVKIRWPNFETITRQITLPQPTDQDKVIYETASTLFLKEWKPGKKVRLIGVVLAQIGDDYSSFHCWIIHTRKKRTCWMRWMRCTNVLVRMPSRRASSRTITAPGGCVILYCLLI